MTNAASLSDPAPRHAAVLKRRLVGLAVLLGLLFLLSLMLRSGAPSPNALPVVVIPLDGSGASADPVVVANTAPVLDAPEQRVAAPPSSSAAAPGSASASKPSASKPIPAEATAKSAVKPKPAAEKSASAIKKPAPAQPPAAALVSPRRWFVVVGAYKDPMAAQAIANRVRLAGLQSAAIPITSAGERLHRVRAGPFETKETAESARATLIVEGLTKAILVSEK